MAQSDARSTGDQEVAGSIRVRKHSFVEIDHEYFLRIFSASADLRRAVVSFWQKNVHKYWLSA